MSLGLSQITNDAEATIKFLEKYGKYFDKWFVTVADKDRNQYPRLKRWFAGIESGYLYDNTLKPTLILSFYKWTDDFAAARNSNLATVDTDYWMWFDSDDEIVNPERIPDLLNVAIQNNIDVVQLKYDYAQNKGGEAISDHWRERLIKRSYEGKWDAPVHETFQGPPAAWEQSDWVVVKHNKSPEDVVKSMKRNEKLLTKHWEETKDPRDAFYLGMTAMGAQNHKEAIQWFVSHIQTAGSDEDKYRSWCRIAECEWILTNYDQAMYATDEAVKLKPHFPDAYFIKVLILAVQEKYEDAIEWMKVAMSKPKPETMHMVDPTLYEYRGLANGAQCYLFSGKVKEAYRIYNYVKEKNPDFFKEMGKLDGIDWETIFEDAYFDQKAVDYIQWLLHYTKGNSGKPEKLFEALPSRIFNDVRLNAERANFLPKKVWPKKSIVWYCGQGTETWGPDTLDKGMGGSEEAVVYLSRELAKLGWQVTVYNERDEEYVDTLFKDDGSGDFAADVVTYKPWTVFNPQDEFDVFVAWRIPGLTRDIKARLKVADMHDMPFGHAEPTNGSIKTTDKFFFKSNYHAAQTKVPKDKTVVVGNGIVKSQFEGKS